MHYQQGGGKYPIHIVPNSYSQGEFASVKKTGTNAFVQGELAFMHLGALFA
jgi:hypothetical protein